MKKLITLFVFAFYINANAQCTVSITPSSAVICSGTSATLTANGATSCTWMPGGMNTPTITVNPGVTTVYTVTATSGTCTVTDTALVSVLPNPVAGFLYAICTCIGTNNTAFLDTTHALSGDSIAAWHWTFLGQGYYTTSTTKNPTEDPANGSDTVCLTVTTQHGCTASTCTIIANYTEAIRKINGNPILSVFPNPTHSVIDVLLTGNNEQDTEIQITDALGNTVIKNREIKTQNYHIDVSNLTNGVYFIKTAQGTAKFVKQ